MSVSPSASRIPLADRDGVVVACRVEVSDSPPIVPSRRPDAREVRVGRRVVELETTWREILLSAIQVGRPALLWLALFPDFAEEEFRGRVAPLRAYLGMDKSPVGMPVVRRSVLYKHGAETTERAGFAYRLGMTMADWLCVTRLGMPSLTHLTLLPHDHPVRRASSRVHRSPDLVASRPGRRPSIAIVEAKCSEHLRLRERYEGAFQLDELRATGALRHYLQLLCGISIEPHLFLLVDMVSSTWLGNRHWLRDVHRWPGPAPWQSLTPVEQFWRRLLVYRILQSVPHVLRVDTVASPPFVGLRRLAPEETMLADHGRLAPIQILAAQIAGTGITVGLTGRAFVETRNWANTVNAALQQQLRRLLRSSDMEVSPTEIGSDFLAMATGHALTLVERRALLSTGAAANESRTPGPRGTAYQQSSVNVEELITASQTLEVLRDPSAVGRQVQALAASEIYIRLDETWA